MPGWMLAYVRHVERLNRIVGRFAMYLLFVMMGILLWSSISKTFFVPAHWTLLMAQFTMTAYFILGGPYSLQLGSNVRMDLLYGAWSPRTKAWADALTVATLIFYLGVLLYGGISSATYAIQYGEESRGLWRAPMWPIKTIMCLGVLLMILQAVALLIRDIATLRGETLPDSHAMQEAR
ncbi:TRAP transporter small permease subunit [Limibaculum sp. M0105]|uniref:TRAP transporter small permease protein n=1 Tax=Thermohalobaculum xanthum TaxID=2753746 RepID=A0A8J7M8A5_9RHOB|nr:TRAP transporter small permease subunit [Thermohalobaculum xanthum]MBK0399429.1 TRAP transporter small permease subunit [Thermohalobaculum xanthum]